MSAFNACALLGLLAATARGQQAGPVQPEVHPPFPIEECTQAGGCVQKEGNVVLDMQWRWLHDKQGYTNCLAKGTWNTQYCPDPQTCSRGCALEGLDLDGYSQTYGVDVVDGGIKLHYVAPTGAVASRVYMLENENSYRMFKMKNREFTFTADLSTLPCGINGALYLVEMPADGGYDGDLNTAGAKYGTGYCDAQCPRGMKFVKNEADLLDYKKIDVKTPENKWIKSGPVGHYGACCAEMDILEGNREASSFTAHPCDNPGTTACEGEEGCGSSDKGKHPSECDKDGCGFNAYQLGNHDFFGNGMSKQVDSSKPITVVTQFHTIDGTDMGDLSEIRRLFIQDGQVVNLATVKNVDGGFDSITDDFCDAVAKKFNETTYSFKTKGGLARMGQALDRGMVLTMSVWDDSLSRMLWLDAVKNRIDLDMNDPGVVRGPCAFESGVAKELHKSNKDAYVQFTNVKYGEIGSTFQGAMPARKFEVHTDEQEVAAYKPVLGSPAATFGAAAIAAVFVFIVALRAGRFNHLLWARDIAGNDIRLLTRSPLSADEEESNLE